MLDVVVSGDRAGRLVVHTLRTGAFVRLVDDALGGRAPVDAIALSDPAALVAAHARATRATRVLSLNADRVAAAADRRARARCSRRARHVPHRGRRRRRGARAHAALARAAAHVRPARVRPPGLRRVGAPVLARASELFVGTDAGGRARVTDPRLGLLQLDASLHQTFVGL